MAQTQVQPVRVVDQNEPFFKEAEDVALEFINLSLSIGAKPATVKKAPHLPGKKPEGEPGLLRTEEGEYAQSEPELPDSLPQLGAVQQSRPREQLGVAAGPPPPPSDVSRSRLIAERLKDIGDAIDKDIEDETKIKLTKLFQNIPVYSISRQDFTSTCRSILASVAGRLPTGWHQVFLVYNAMFQTIVQVQQYAGDTPMVNRERQVANFVGPTLVDLELQPWLDINGGLENFGAPVEGEGATVRIEESSVDHEN